MNAEIIAVGTELLLGDILNTDAQFLAKELAALGINVHYQITVGDNGARLRKVIADSLTRSDIIITTGGLGPTTDDLTKETISQVIGIPLELHQPSLDRIKDYFAKTNREVSPNNIKQAMMPVGCTVFENDFGTAPGCAIKKGDQCIIMLPGPPRELIPMVNDKVIPYLKDFSGETIISKNLRVFGIGEADIESRLGNIFESQNPTVALYAKEGEVLIRVTAKAKNKGKADELIAPKVDEIWDTIGEYIYGEDVNSLEEVVVKKLKDFNLKIATAESCTGGLLSKKITDVPGSSDVFEYGISAYSNRIKEVELGVPSKIIKNYGAVSPQVACAMAIGVLNKSGADLSVGITGIAGPTSDSTDKQVGLVYIAIANQKRVWVKQLNLRDSETDRNRVRALATLHALDFVRLYVDKYPEMPVGAMMHDEAFEACESNLLINVQHEKKPKEKLRWYQKFVKYYIPLKGDPKREIFRKSVFLFAVGVLVFSLSYLANYFISGFTSQAEIDDIKTKLYGVVDPDVIMPDGYLKKFSSLYKDNTDIAGWIKISGTQLDYPVMQAEDNDFYLRRTFYKKNNKYGVPFVDYRCDIKNLGDNTVVYGHNMGNNDYQMFGSLKNYTGRNKLDYIKEHNIISFDTIYKEMNWKIVSVFITNTKPEHGEVFSYNNFVGTQSESSFNEFVDEIRKRSLFDMPVDVAYGDKLLTLSTCTYEFTDARLVVVARLVRDGESTEIDTSQIKINEDPLFPPIWYQLGYTSSAGQSSENNKPSSQATDSETSESKSSEPGTTSSHTGSNTSSSTPPVSSDNPSSVVSSETSSGEVSSDITSSDDSSSTVTSSEDTGSQNTESEMISSEEQNPPG